MVDRPKPMTAIAGGEGGVGGNREQAKADLRVYLERRVRVGGGRSAVDGGLAAVCKAGTALQWTKAKEIGPMRTSEAS